MQNHYNTVAWYATLRLNLDSITALVTQHDFFKIRRIFNLLVSTNNTYIFVKINNPKVQTLGELHIRGTYNCY